MTCCEAWRRPQLDLSGQVIGQGRIGTGIASLVAYLRTTLRLPTQQIKEYLQTLHMLRLSKGKIVELTHDVRQQLQGTADKLLEQARSQAIVHQDETGWRENGQNGYVWTVATDVHRRCATTSMTTAAAMRSHVVSWVCVFAVC